MLSYQEDLQWKDGKLEGFNGNEVCDGSQFIFAHWSIIQISTLMLLWRELFEKYQGTEVMIRIDIDWNVWIVWKHSFQISTNFNYVGPNGY